MWWIDRMRGTDFPLRFSDGLETPRRHKGKDRRTEARDFPARNQHGPAQHIRIDLVQDRIALRNSAAIDHAPRGRAVFRHSIENDAGVERRSLNGRKQLDGGATKRSRASASASRGTVRPPRVRLPRWSRNLPPRGARIHSRRCNAAASADAESGPPPRRRRC